MLLHAQCLVFTYSDLCQIFQAHDAGWIDSEASSRKNVGGMNDTRRALFSSSALFGKGVISL